MNILYIKYYTILIFLLLLQHSLGDAIQVTVEQGTLEGEKVTLNTNNGYYYSFKGIPYAQPPIGPLRFKAPLPALPWEGVRNAKEHGATCPQADVLSNTYIPGNEDCLFINVYSPEITPNNTRLIPVVMYIHGGYYKSGSGNVDFYGPDFLVSKNMVVVTINYRLDVLGFMTLDTEDVPGNAGLKDQVMALKWVKTNIEQFGGDPDKVTLMGESAGSACVGFHIISPMSQGLFHRAIALSGSPYSEWSLGFENQRRALVLGENLGFKTKDLNALLRLLQNVPVNKLIDATAMVLSSEEYTNNILKLTNFVPVVEKYSGENNFISYDFYKNISHVNKVDIMFGFTKLEAVTAIDIITRTGLLQNYAKYKEMFVPYKTLQRFEPLEYLEFADKIIDHYFGNKSIDINSMKEFINYSSYLYAYDAVEYFSSLPVIGNTVRYLYQFSSVSERNVYGQLGQQYNIINATGHLDDTMYLFDPKSMNLILDINSLEYQLIDQFTTLFANFIIHGNPTPDSTHGVTWPTFDITSKQYLDIGNTLSVSSLQNHDEYNYWNQFYSSIGTYL